jgi:hypothetical protein
MLVHVRLRLRLRLGLVLCGAAALVTPTTVSDARPARSSLVWCSPETFRFAGLRNSVGAERASDEPAAVLRALLASRRRRQYPDQDWKVLARRPDNVLFGNHETRNIVTIRLVLAEDGQWRLERVGWCRELLRVRGGIVAAPWRLRRGTQPTERRRVFRLLVHEHRCASGRSARGRIEPPLVIYARRVVKVATFVRPRRGAQTCQGNPDTPFVLRLADPLGKRRLLDVGVIPATRLKHL